MKSNMEIFNEAFFKKATYAEKQAKRLPQYSPVDTKSSTISSSPLDSNGMAYRVVDTDEVKRRLATTFGAAFGNNNIKNLASRSLKTFPILVSDNVEPETVIMLKKLMEEQYAEYINLLVSNQVVNLSDYTAGDETGNIAIQALDTLSGTDFSKSRIANTAARTGKLTTDSIFQNVPLYNLLRESPDTKYSCGDEILDNLFEDAVVVPNDMVDSYASFLQEHSDEIVSLREILTEDLTATNKDLTLKDFSKTIDTYDNNLNKLTGNTGVSDADGMVVNKLTSADIVLDKDRLDNAINRSIGEMLCDPENKEIRNRFEKATFLLQTRRISGTEYYQYLTLRLGIPVSDRARIKLATHFKSSQVRVYGYSGQTELSKIKFKDGIYTDENKKNSINNRTASQINSDRTLAIDIARNILSVKVAVAVGVVGAGLGLLADGIIRGGAGAGIKAFLEAIGLPALVNLLVSCPWLGGIAGAILGAGSMLVIRAVQKRRVQKELDALKERGFGWERVEMLIKEMEKQQAEINTEIKATDLSKFKTDEEFKDYVYKNKINVDYDFLLDDGSYLSDKDKKNTNLNKALNNNEEEDYRKQAYELLNAKKDYVNKYEDYTKRLSYMMKESKDSDSQYETFNESINLLKESPEYLTENFINEQNKMFEEFIEEDPDLKAALLAEKAIQTSVPMTVKYIEKKPDKDVLITPAFMARDTYAYGSTEIERKDNKDRRYNQPLIMTIKFKERFDSDRYSDNELTAVIGILGKVIRIPSSEMEYILKENIEGNTIEGIFKGTADLSNTISSLLSGSKISKDLEKLPQSSDIWRNLEKVATLAATNNITGRKNSNIANAHIIFSQKEIDDVRIDSGVDYLKDIKRASALMRRYSAFTLMIANDAGQRVQIMDDPDNISWEVVPYSAVAGKDSGEQLNAALTKMMRL